MKKRRWEEVTFTGSAISKMSPHFTTLELWAITKFPPTVQVLKCQLLSCESFPLKRKMQHSEVTDLPWCETTDHPLLQSCYKFDKFQVGLLVTFKRNVVRHLGKCGIKSASDVFSWQYTVVVGNGHYYIIIV